MTHAMTQLSSLIVRALAAVALVACGTQTVRVEPVKVEPIHVTVDVNLHDAGSGVPAAMTPPGRPPR